MKTPLDTVKEQHGDKAKLVDKILGLLASEEADLKARLESVSNKKLLKLLTVSQTVKDKYGSPQKLAAHVADALGKAKDSDYVKRLEKYTPSKLLDMAQSLAKRAGGTAKAVAHSAKETAVKATAKAKSTATAAAKATKTTAAKATKAVAAKATKSSKK